MGGAGLFGIYNPRILEGNQFARGNVPSYENRPFNPLMDKRLGKGDSKVNGLGIGEKGKGVARVVSTFGIGKESP